MKKYIPNILTLLNLFCGCIGVIFAMADDFVNASLFVFLGIFFDFFDGFAARKLKVQSELGLQLDSLADLVTSGLVPGITMYKLLQLIGPSWQVTVDGIGYNRTVGFEFEHPEFYFVLPLLGLSITLASAYRLAKFNIDTEQQNYFKGLPTPANALLILSLPLIMEFHNNDFVNEIILNKWFLLGVTALSCYLLNSKIKLFALKFKEFSFKANATRYIFLILCIVLLVVLQFIAIPIIILLYIVMSVIDSLTSKHT